MQWFLIISLLLPLNLLAQVSTEKLMERAAEKAKGKDYSGAVDDYDRAIAGADRYPLLHMIYMNRGIAKSYLLDTEGSMRDFDTVIALKPDYAEPYVWRGTGYFKMKKDLPKALADYTEAIVLDSSKFDTYLYRGDVYFKLSRYPEAVQDYTRAIKISPEDPHLYTQRVGAYYHLKEYEMAIGDCNTILRLQPDNAEIYMLRGICKSVLAEEDVEGACADFRKSKQLGFDTRLNGIDKYCGTDDLEK